MAKRHHYRRHKEKEEAEIDVTTFLNLMVVLIPFLLITAVFSRITIQELNIPQQAAGGDKPDKPLVTIEVIIRQDSLEMTDGEKITATIKKVDGKHDIKALSDRMVALKDKYKDKDDAIVLVEPDIEYDDVISVMDAVKVAEVKLPDQAELERILLFPRLSLGEAP